MRKVVCIVLIMTLVLSFSACKSASTVVKPVKFYYLNDAEHFFESAIREEIRDCSGLEEDFPGLLQQYLNGPESDSLASPFPKKLTVKEAKIRGITVHLTVSDAFVQLSGLDMTLACACITMTALEYTGAQRLSITATDSYGSILYTASLTQEDILLIDNTNLRE